MRHLLIHLDHLPCRQDAHPASVANATPEPVTGCNNVTGVVIDCTSDATTGTDGSKVHHFWCGSFPRPRGATGAFLHRYRQVAQIGPPEPVTGAPGRNTRMLRFHAQCEEPYAIRILRRRLGLSPQGILS